MGLIKKEMVAKKQEVLDYHKKNWSEDKNMTIEKFTDWVNCHSEDPLVIEMKDCIANLNDEIFTKKQMSHIDFSKEIPEKFTQESYFKTFERVWAVIRYEIWKEITGNGQGASKVTDEKFAQVYNAVHERFEDIRIAEYCKIMDEDPKTLAEGTPRLVMQKAYVTFASAPDGTEFSRKV